LLLVRQLIVALLVVLLVAESSGVARAFGPGSIVTCCCGPHSAARRCKCLHCPVAQRDDHDHDHERGGARIAAAQDCDGNAPEEAVLDVEALLITPIAVPTPAAMSLRATWSLPELADRLTEPTRPPP